MTGSELDLAFHGKPKTAPGRTVLPRWRGLSNSWGNGLSRRRGFRLDGAGHRR